MISDNGGHLADAGFATTTAGHAAALAFLNAHGRVRAMGVEGTSSYGAGFTRAARSAGQADYNLDVLPSSWQETADDIASPPDPHSADRERYGLVRDTGRDDAPVPQYATRSTPTDAGTVPQHSAVS
ncbi:hypothetical protein [Streptomyces sp. NPDC005799]|uniref:hypothetical protein n=1 Tax=Streptomyces sp. NPDC005799 TaxID=3154678 RepID=UPI0033DB169C